MATDERLTNLMFLLSLPSLAIGCAGGGVSTTLQGPPVVDPTTGDDDDDDDDDDETASAETAGADTGTSGVVDDGPPPMTDGGPTPMTDDGEETIGGYECMGMPPMVDMIGPLCIQYVAHYGDCFYGGMQPPFCVAIYEAYCQSYIDSSYQMYGPYCAMAIEEVYTCLSQVPCPQLMDETGDCVPQFMAVDEACASG